WSVIQLLLSVCLDVLGSRPFSPNDLLPAILPGTTSLGPSRPARTCVLLSRHPQQVSSTAEETYAPVPPTMHSGGTWERGRSYPGAPELLRVTEQKEITMYLNQLTIIGFTGNEAEVHYTPSGTLVTTL